MNTPRTSSDLIRNTRLGIAVFLALIGFVVWLAMGRPGTHYRKHFDMSAIPMAREVTSAEIGSLRNGHKPAPIVAIRPTALPAKPIYIDPFEPEPATSNSVRDDLPSISSGELELENPTPVVLVDFTSDSPGQFQPKFSGQPELLPNTKNGPAGDISPPPNEEQIFTSTGGESWWTIAQSIYSDGNYFRALYEHNKYEFPDYESIPEGAKVRCPQIDVLDQISNRLTTTAERNLRSAAAEYQPTYVTVSGDTLFEVARDQLGQASRYTEILALNRQQLPKDIAHLTLLQRGLRLRLPSQSGK